MVESNCATFDGIVGATASVEAIHNGADIDVEFTFKFTTSNKGEVLAVVDNPATLREIMIYKITDVSNPVKLYLYQVDGTAVVTEMDAGLVADTWYTLRAVCADGVITTYDRDGNVNVTNTYDGTIRLLADSNLKIGLGAPFVGSIANLCIGYAEYNFAEGWGTTLYNIGTAGGDALLTGATLSTFWGTKQDIYHYNINNNISKAISSKTSGVFYCENNSAYGEWRFKVWKDPSSDLEIYFITPHLDTTTSSTYRLRLSSVERVMLYEGTNTLMYTVSPYVPTSEWVDYRVTRSLGGEFAIYQNDVLVTPLLGTNPIIDNTYTTSINQVFSMNPIDALRISERDNVEQKLTDMTYSTGTWEYIYLPEDGDTGLDVSGEEISNPPGMYHNLAETKFKLPADAGLIAIDNLLDTPVFYTTGVPNAVHPDDIASVDLQNKHVIFSFTVDNKFAMLLFYSSAKTGSQIAKMVKCAIKKLGSNVTDLFMLDENGDYMLTEDGHYMEME